MIAGDFSTFKTDLLKTVATIQQDAVTANDRYIRESKERKRLHNLVAELKGNIRVFCRVRPANRDELASGDKIGITPAGPSELFVAASTETDNGKAVKKPSATFEFDRVFGPTSTQAEVFDEVSAIIAGLMRWRDLDNMCIALAGETNDCVSAGWLPCLHLRLRPDWRRQILHHVRAITRPRRQLPHTADPVSRGI